MIDVQKYIQEQGPALVQQLTSKGFNQQQAQGFVQKLAARVPDVLKGGYDPKSLLGGGDLTGLMGRLGIGDLANKIGVDFTKATEGAKTILPGLVWGLQKQGGLEGSQGAGGAAGDIPKKPGGFPGLG